MSTDRIEKLALLRTSHELAWRAISDASQFGRWFGATFDRPFAAGARLTARIAPTTVDPEVAKLQAPHAGKAFAFHVENIEPKRRIAFRWHPYAVQQDLDYASEPMTLIEFELYPRADGVRLCIRESGFDALPAERRAEAYAANDSGWSHQARLVEKFLAAAPRFSHFAAVDLGALPSLARMEARRERVRSLVATPQSLQGLGRIVTDFAAAQVAIVTWPQPGWRPVVAGTGNEGGTVEDVFVMERRGEVLHAVNQAVGRSYITGWFADPATASEARAATDTSRIYTHEANYHPDGGQIFWPRDGAPFVALLARPGDDIRPADFIAFQCDGSFGIHIDPDVWHQPLFPLRARATFDDRQGRVHACVAVDFISEFGCYLEVPLG